MREELYYFWLQSLSYFSYEERLQMLGEAGSPEALFQCSAKALFEMGFIPSFPKQEQYEALRSEEKLLEAYEKMQKKGLSFTAASEENFPENLDVLRDRPFGLFYRSALPENGQPSVAIIGARRCSEYGKEMAYFFGNELGKAGVQVISGMALGVDGYAQKGAVAAGGKSYAVLAGGADVCYPRENIGLYESLRENGGILSERMPGVSAVPRDFPIRNRIISALADVVIVIEAAENSGSLITVNQALSQNKEVFALPGRVGDRMSKGCNELLKNGAQVLTCPEDVLQYLGLPVKKDTEKRKKIPLAKEEEAVLKLITKNPVSMENLIHETGFPVSTLSEILIRLEIKGLIKREGLGGYTQT